jgi:hypothetical protein
MSDFKFSLNFSSPGAGKWSEVYFMNATDIATAAANAAQVASIRAWLLHVDNSITTAKLINVANQREGVIKPININGLDLAGDPYPDSVSAVCTLGSSTTGASRRLWMRGCSDASIHRDSSTGLLDQSAFFRDRLKDFFNVLPEYNVEIRSLKRVDGTDVVNMPILSAAPIVGNSGLTTLTLAAAFTPPVNQRVIISKSSLKDAAGLNGHWTVVQQPTTTTLVIPYRMAAGATAVGGGSVKQEVYQYGVINPQLCGVSALGSHKSVNFYSNSRGAKSGKRIRLLA